MSINRNESLADFQKIMEEVNEIRVQQFCRTWKVVLTLYPDHVNTLCNSILASQQKPEIIKVDLMVAHDLYYYSEDEILTFISLMKILRGLARNIAPQTLLAIFKSSSIIPSDADTHYMVQ